MYKKIVLFMSLVVLLSSCSYRQFGAIATGSSLGGMFGSSIGGLMGGWRGSDKGTVAGMLIGGALGAVVTSSNTPNEKQPSHSESYESDYRRERNDTPARAGSPYDSEVTYGSYNQSDYRMPSAAHSDLEFIEVTDIRFLDANNNRALDPNEEATLVMDVYNRSDKTLYNLTPHIICNNRRVQVSPAATVESLPSGRGIRYKTGIRAGRRLKADYLLFTVSFGTGRQAVVARSFKIKAN